MSPTWRVDPAPAATVVDRVAQTDLHARRYSDALDDLLGALPPAADVEDAVRTFASRHRELPDRLQQRIVDVAAGARAVLATVTTGDETMATQIALASAATAALPR